MLKKMGLTPKPFRSRLLIYVPLIAALYMFVWPTAYRFFASSEPGPLIPKFTNHLVTNNFWETFPSVAVAIPFLLICGFLTVYFLGQKVSAPTPVLTADFLVSRTSCRPGKSELPTRAINVGTALPPAPRTFSSTRR